MSSQLAQNFMGIPVEELVPDAAAVRGVSRSSLLTGRRRVRLSAQTGASAGSWTSATAGTSANGQIIQFVLADSSSLLDLNSVVLSCTAQTFATSANTCTLQDGPSFIRRITVSLNGTVVDDTDLANRFCNANVYGGSDRAYYNGAGSFAGFWAQNSDLAVPQTFQNVSTIAVNSLHADISGASIYAAQRYQSSQGYQGGYPLALVSSLFRAKQYLPLSQVGEMVIQIVLASPGEACFVANSSAPATFGYALSDVFLEADFIQPHYLYQEMLNRVTQLEGEQGMVIAYDATISTQGQAITTSGTASIVTSLATNNLRKIILTFAPTSWLTAINYPSVQCFPNMGISDVQFRIGSLYFPSQTANSIGRIWQMTQSAFNGGDPLHHGNGVVDYNTWCKTTSPNTYGSTMTTRGCANQFFGDSMILAYSFDCLKGGEELMADGISVLGQAGSQIQTNVTLNGTLITNGVLATIHLTRTRYLVLKNGSLRVEGV